jgi:hypothetical protein
MFKKNIKISSSEIENKGLGIDSSPENENNRLKLKTGVE